MVINFDNFSNIKELENLCLLPDKTIINCSQNVVTIAKNIIQCHHKSIHLIPTSDSVISDSLVTHVKA